MSGRHRTHHASIAAVIAAGLGLTLAAAPLTVDATAVTFADAPTLVSVDLEWHDGLVLVFSDGAGSSIGVDAIVPDATSAADGTITLTRAGIDGGALASGLVSDVRSGVVLTFDTAAMRDLQAQITARLAALGFEVRADADRPTILHASNGSAAYRLVFSYDDGSALRLYVGS